MRLILGIGECDPMISIHEKLCKGCGICVDICPRRVLRLKEKKAEVTDPAMCMSCGHCKAVCPRNAPGFPTGDEGFEPLPSQANTPSSVDLLDFIRRRRSIRRYLETSVEKEKLEMMIQAGRYSPTGGNRQACDFTIVTGRKNLDQVCTLAIQQLLHEGRVIREAFERCERSAEPVRRGRPAAPRLRRGRGPRRHARFRRRGLGRVRQAAPAR